MAHSSLNQGSLNPPVGEVLGSGGFAAPDAPRAAPVHLSNGKALGGTVDAISHAAISKYRDTTPRVVFFTEPNGDPVFANRL